MQRSVVGAFPGQGTQRFLTLIHVARQHPNLIETLSQGILDVDNTPELRGDDQARFSLEGSCLKDESCLEEMELRAKATDVAQTVVLGMSLGALEQDRNEFWNDHKRRKRVVVVGHSAGEISALVAAHAVSIYDAGRIARVRGLCMDRVVRKLEFKPSMMAVLGMNREGAESVEREAKREGVRCHVAAYNGLTQHVLSGDEQGVAWGVARCKSHYGAKSAIRLNVSAPFHTPWMRPAALELEKFLFNVHIERPSIPIIMNATATETIDPDEIKSNLVQGVTEPIRFVECLDTAAAIASSLSSSESSSNIVDFVEFGAHSLTKALQSSWPQPPITPRSRVELRLVDPILVRG